MMVHGMRAVGLCCLGALVATTAPAQVRVGREISSRAGAEKVQSARYTVDWKELRFDGKGPQKAEGTLSAKMLFKQNRFRFDIVEKKGARTSLVLDARNFVTVFSAKEAGGKRERTTAKNVSADSPWIMAYPLLVAHGIVPFPPFDRGGLRRLPSGPPRSSSSDRQVSSGNVRELKRSGEPFSVRVTMGRGDVIARYEIVDNKNHRTVLRIGVQFRDGQRAAGLQRYSIVWFSDSGKATRRVDAQVKECQENVAINLASLAPPSDPAQLRAILNASRDLKVKVQATMSLEQLVASLQRSLGDKLQVRVDDEAFSERFKSRMRDMEFDTDAVAVEDALFSRLQEHGIDFYFDDEGMVIVPTHVAWKHSEFFEYAAKDYSLSVPELRTLLYNAVLPDDWSDMGGPGEMIVDEDAGSVGIVHRQSQQMQLRRALDALKRDEE